MVILAHNKTDFIGRYGNYILLIPDGNFKSLVVELLWLAIGGNAFTRLWNSEARFVVVGANELLTAQKSNTFRVLSQYRMYNSIVSRQ
jgi:hypothetical protein